MIIECPKCDAKVDAKEKASYIAYSEELDLPFNYSLLVCPSCDEVILGIQEGFQVASDETGWSEASRLWPEPNSYFDSNIPDIVRTSLYEAKLCYKVRAYNACAVMCRRAIEGICKKYGTKNNLSAGLKELSALGIIDGKILKWSDELRIRGNIGAHASEENITREDAQDILDFAVAISEYVFVLSEKFEKFMQRKNKAIS